MAKLELAFASTYKRDVKTLDKNHIDTTPLDEVQQLILDNTRASQKILKQRHKMHKLKGKWKGSNECHVCNVGDWLLVWTVRDNVALMQRTGKHDDIFR